MDRITYAVVIPTYCRQEQTVEAINSVDPSDVNSWEIIVVDDASKIPFVFNSPKNICGVPVRVVYSSVNGGAGVARGIGVSASASSYILFLDSDDVYCAGWPNHVQNMIKSYADRYLSLDFLVGQANNPSLVVSLAAIILNRLPVRAQLMFVRFAFTFSNIFHTPSVVMKRELFSGHPSLRYCEDYYTNAWAAMRTKSFFFSKYKSFQPGHLQGRPGGLSSAKAKMLLGEFIVKLDLLASRDISNIYKIFILLGLPCVMFREVFLLIRNFKPISS